MWLRFMSRLCVCRTCTKTWSRSSQSFTRGRTASSTLAVLMPTLDCLRYVFVPYCLLQTGRISSIWGLLKNPFTLPPGSAGPRWRSAVWRAEPCLHHRWDPSVPSEEAALQTHGPQWSGEQAQRVPGVCVCVCVRTSCLFVSLFF